MDPDVKFPALFADKLTEDDKLMDYQIVKDLHRKMILKDQIFIAEKSLFYNNSGPEFLASEICGLIRR